MNSKYINSTSGHNPTLFTSTPKIHGGTKKLKKKLNTISKKYKKENKKVSRKLKSLGLKKNKREKTKKNKTRRKKRVRQKGGNYSVGGILSPNNLALANRPPINIDKNMNCFDTYTHFK